MPKTKKATQPVAAGCSQCAKENNERYLKLPNRILNMLDFSIPTRLLLAYIDSFGLEGCWANNETLAKMFDVTTRTITERIGQLKKTGRIWWVHPRSPYRTIWSNTHPEVKASDTLIYRGREVLKAELLGNKLPSNIEGGFQVTSKNGRELHRSTLPTDKNHISNDIKAKPALAGRGQPALLQDKEIEQYSNIKKFENNFGSHRECRRPGLTPEKFEKRRQDQLKALLRPQEEKLEQVI
jgi:hypothetical protein